MTENRILDDEGLPGSKGRQKGTEDEFEHHDL
jgi:hypothetical protein